MHRCLLFVCCAAALACWAPSAPAADAAGGEFFEKKVRPVLVEHCLECHGPKKQRGGLRLDSRKALMTGGDSGPAVVPGKPDDSRLIRAVRHADDLKMPPKEQLPAEQVAALTTWVKMGAPWPGGGDVRPDAAKGYQVTARDREFWSFRPVKETTPPVVKDKAWAKSPIDAFVLAKLEEKGLRPAPAADRRTLLRRVTIDLIGLPPTPEEIDAFLKDESPDAFAKVVDRLLASPAYGERWGRHWLDVARYADSNGKDENLTFHDAWRYRDYVLAAFNKDKPFDRFVIEQVAGDLLPGDDAARRDEQLTASGFLIVGPKVLADRDQLRRKMDVIDEQIDTVGRAFLGLTLGCARCHDHKFDPIPTTDYYALAGIFASTRTLDGFKLNNPVVSGWSLRPLGGAEGEARLAAWTAHQKQATAVADRIKKAKADLKTVEDRATMRSPGKLVGITIDDKDAKLVGTWKPSTFARPYVGDGYRHDDKSGKGEKSATFTPKLPKAGEYEVLIAYTAAPNRATNTPVTIRHAEGETTATVNQTEAPPIDGLFRSLGKFKFAEGTSGSVTIANKGTDGYVIIDAVRFVPVGALEKDREMAMGVPEEVRKQLADAKKKLTDLEAEEKALKAKAPAAPALVMAPRDEDKPGDVCVCVRGNPHQTGAEVPRGFLSVVGDGKKPAIPSDRSGRLELAKWLADKDNPLTARVFVNRVWTHLFGEGLVRTVDNFGSQGERPSHPELLDHLARRFVADGWSVKKLIRAIVLSRTYQMACVPDAAAAKVDPENRLLWRANRRRVEAEVIRDSILAVSGKLDRTAAGSPVAGLGEQAINNNSLGGLATDANPRRSVYLPVIRNDLPQIFEVFDFADPDVSTGKRDATTVATQALYLMNSTFVMEQSRHTARRLLALSDDEARLTDLYRRALGRTPSDKEKKAALAYLAEARKLAKKPADADVEAWAGVCQAVFGCTEFRFVE